MTANPFDHPKIAGSSAKPGQRVLLALRRMIATGEIADGERIAEIATAERLGVSRMPVRTALRSLALEGLVVPLGRRGYAACRPNPALLAGAIQVRGALEGLAARLAAQHPNHAAIGERLADIVAPCATLLAQGPLDAAGLATYFAANSAFHDLLVGACGNPAIGLALAQNNRLPLAGAHAFAFDVSDAKTTRGLLTRAHDEHMRVARCVREGEDAWAEEVMRRHAEASLAVEQGLVPAG